MGKIILVTGGSSRLGIEIVKKLAMGDTLVYAGIRDVGKLNFKNRNVFSIKLDITKDADCKKTVEFIYKKHGRIDVLVNCAGYSIIGPTVNFTSKDYLSILNTNVVGAFRLIREVFPHMVKHGGGKIINITSLHGLIPVPNFGLYNSSKFAFEALGQTLRYEFEKNNVFVTNIAPGAIKSHITKKVPFPHKPFREKFKLLDILMPMITTEEIAKNVMDVVMSSNPPVSLMLGSDTKITNLLHRFLPSFFWGKLQSFVWNKK